MMLRSWINRLKKGDSFAAIHASDWNRIANVLETIEGEGGIHIRKTDSGLNWRIVADESQKGTVAPGTWRPELNSRGKLVVHNCVVSFGSRIFIFTSGPIDLPSENDGSRILVCDLTLNGDSGISVAFSFQPPGPYEEPAPGVCHEIECEIEFQTQRIPLYMFLGGTATLDLIHGAFCPFAYDTLSQSGYDIDADDEEEEEEEE